MKNDKGVTLIALIITIIILVILVGTGLKVLQDDKGVVENANQAVTQYHDDSDVDQKLINSIDNLFLKYMGPDEYIPPHNT